MKKYIRLILVATLSILSIQCTKEAALQVSLANDTVKLKCGKAADLAYSVSDNTGTVTASLAAPADGIAMENTFSGTEGTLTFSCTADEGSDREVRVVFRDRKYTVEKTIRLHISSSWGVEPDEPVQQ